MLGTLAVIFLLLWAGGLVSSYTIGGFIHIFAVMSVVLVLVNVTQARPRDRLTGGRHTASER